MGKTTGIVQLNGGILKNLKFRMAICGSEGKGVEKDITILAK